MVAAIIAVFAVGYLAITLEHPIKLDKTVPALMMAAIMWALLSLGFHFGIVDVVDSHGHLFTATGGDHHATEGFTNTLLHHLGKTAEILVFLIGAMTIVELIDLHRGFAVVTDRIKTNSKKK